MKSHSPFRLPSLPAGGKPIDANQEMIALGLCNFFGSFVSAYPTTGSFSRTAVNSASGVKTQFGGVYTGALVILAIAVLMPACAYIPKATLAAVIITAVVFSIEHHVVKPMWQASSKCRSIFEIGESGFQKHKKIMVERQT